MEADTKKKRGRPELTNTTLAKIGFPDKETRAAQNICYAGTLIIKAGYGIDSFFVTSKGAIRRQGIAEQIGRMLDTDLITIEDAKELAQWAIDKYNGGDSVKTLTNALRLYRLNLAAEARADRDQEQT